METLKLLPKVKDSLSYLFLEHCKIEQTANGIEFFNKEGSTLVPVANITTLLLGPGTSISHSAVKSIIDAGCLLLWTGEECVRTYGFAFGETYKSYKLQRQAELVSNQESRKDIALKMYKFRFKENFSRELSFEQIQGMEGKRVKEEYAAIAKKYKVNWTGRNYNRNDWSEGDDLNKALSTASSCLNGICCSAIVSAGYSPGLGFIHQGQVMSFVYDIADLYKTKIAAPVAFGAVAENVAKLETTVRKRCRQAFKNMKLLGRIVKDIDIILALDDSLPDGFDPDEDPYLPTPWWVPEGED